MPASWITSIKYLSGTIVASTSAGFMTWHWPFTAVGIPATVVFMALTGSAAGLLFHAPTGGRLRLFVLMIVYTAVSASAVIVIGKVPGFGILEDVAPAAALLMAFFAQNLIPIARDAIANRTRRTLGCGDP